MESHKSVQRQKRCLCCLKLFDPNPRVKNKQRHCSKTECQNKRQRKNEFDWRVENPQCRKEQNRKWQQKHSDHSRKRRLADPGFEAKNREDTRLRMEKLRFLAMFDKSKSIITQLIGNNMDKCYLAHGKRWLTVRLTRASPLSKPVFMRHTHHRIKRVSNHLPRGRVYDLSGIFKGDGDYG